MSFLRNYTDIYLAKSFMDNCSKIREPSPIQGRIMSFNNLINMLNRDLLNWFQNDKLFEILSLSDGLPKLTVQPPSRYHVE